LFNYDAFKEELKRLNEENCLVVEVKEELKRLDEEYRLIVEKIKNNKIMIKKDKNVDKNLTIKERAKV
jgi:hypothetical protein